MYIRSITACQSIVESSFDNAMIPLAVPFRRKSASLTQFINASCKTFPSASNLTSCSSGQSEKCNISRHGSPALWCCSSPSSQSSPSSFPFSSSSFLDDVGSVDEYGPVACGDEGKGAQPENKSCRRPRG